VAKGWGGRDGTAKGKKKKKRKKWLLLLLLLLLLGGVMAVLYLIWQDVVPRWEAERDYERIRELAYSYLDDGDGAWDEGAGAQVGAGMTGGSGSGGVQRPGGKPNFQALEVEYPDIIGWIYSPGTVIDYPVVQGPDNQYYLGRLPDGRKSVVGSVFLEAANSPDFSDDVSVLYGHHIKGGRMFSSLEGYRKQSYYEEHPAMVLYTRDVTYDVLLFAADMSRGSIGSFPINFGTGEENRKKREDWVKQCLQKSTFSSNIVPEDTDRILALVTCTYDYADARYVVMGVLSPRDGGTAPPAGDAGHGNPLAGDGDRPGD
jgi:sortase B